MDGPATLQQLSAGLDGEIGRFIIHDRSTYTGAMPGRRVIELRSDEGCLGWLTEYGPHPARAYAFSFIPNQAIKYGVLSPVVAALRSHYVRIDEPQPEEGHG